MLGDLPDQGLPVRVGHPVARFDLLLGGDHRVEVGLLVNAVSTVTGGRLGQRALGLLHLVEQALRTLGKRRSLLRGRVRGHAGRWAGHPLSVTPVRRIGKMV